MSDDREEMLWHIETAVGLADAMELETVVDRLEQAWKNAMYGADVPELETASEEGRLLMFMRTSNTSDKSLVERAYKEGVDAGRRTERERAAKCPR